MVESAFVRVRLLCLIAALLIAGFASLRGQSTGLTFASTPIVSTIRFNPPPPVPSTLHPEVPAGRYTMTNPAVGDVNGDGYLDLVFAPSYYEYEPRLPIRIWLNTGTGEFVDRTDSIIEGPVPLVGYPNNVFIADLNRDGRSDIFIVDQGLENTSPFEGATNVLLLSQANGRLRDVSNVLIAETIQTFNHVSSLADVDGNGALDVILSRLGGSRTFGDGILFLLNDGTGNLRPSTTGSPDEIAWKLNT